MPLQAEDTGMDTGFGLVGIGMPEEEGLMWVGKHLADG